MVNDSLLTPQDKVCPIMSRPGRDHLGNGTLIATPCLKERCALWCAAINDGNGLLLASGCILKVG